MKKQKDRMLKDEVPRLVGVQHATEEEWRNSSSKNEQAQPKLKKCAVVDVTGDGSKVWCCKEQYCIGTWNVSSMNPGKLEVIRQEMGSVNIDILEISELKWTRMGKFNSDDYYMGFSDSSLEYSPPAMQETMVRFLGWEDSLERDRLSTPVFLGFPCGSAGKESACNVGILGFDPWVGKIP